MDRKFEIAMEKNARGRKRCFFIFSPMIFYLPSVSHLCKQEILKLERSMSLSKTLDFYFFTRVHLVDNFPSFVIGRM